MLRSRAKVGHFLNIAGAGRRPVKKVGQKSGTKMGQFRPQNLKMPDPARMPDRHKMPAGAGNTPG